MKKILFLFLLIIGLSNCKKTTAPLDDTLELTDFNIRASYRITEVTLNGTSVFATYVPDCKKGDTYVFIGGGKYNYFDEGLMCTTASPASGSVGVLSSNTLSLDGVTYNVDSFTGRGLVISRTVGANKTVITFSR